MQTSFLKIIVFLFLSIQLSAQTIHSNASMKSVIDFDKNYYFAQGQNNQWGLCTSDSKTVIKAEYDSLYPLCKVEFNPQTYALTYINSKFVIGKQGQEYILMDLKGNKKLTANGIMPRLMHQNVVLIQNNNKWGLAQTSGKMLVATNCTAIDWFDDLLGLQQNDKWVLFHPKSGTLMHYDNVIRTNGNEETSLLLLKKGLNWGLMDGNAKVLITLDYESIQPIIGQSDLFLVKKEGSYGIYNIKEQKMILAATYDKIEPYGEAASDFESHSAQSSLLFKVQQGSQVQLLDLEEKLVEAELL